MYAGFTGQTPLQAVRSIGSGHPAGVRNTPSDSVLASIANSVSSVGSSTANVIAGQGLPDLPAACAAYASDHYTTNPAKRWTSGYSDCSSFVGKGLKRIGIKPPGPSTTLSYLGSKDWTKVSSDIVQAGDVAVSTTHMVVCTGNGMALGQQNPRRNVQRGTIQDLMANSGSYMFLRYNPGYAESASGRLN